MSSVILSFFADAGENTPEIKQLTYVEEADVIYHPIASDCFGEQTLHLQCQEELGIVNAYHQIRVESNFFTRKWTTGPLGSIYAKIQFNFGKEGRMVAGGVATPIPHTRKGHAQQISLPYCQQYGKLLPC